jgi:hypothetical protein
MSESNDSAQPLLQDVVAGATSQTVTSAPANVAALFSACNDLVQMLFADENHGVQAIDLAVGPAIPIDMLRYLCERCRTAGSETANKLVLEALMLYLFPQFEGRDSEHDAISGVLARDLEIDASHFNEILSTWTGRAASL